MLFFLSSLAAGGARLLAQSDPSTEPTVIAVGKVWPAVVNVNTERIVKRTYQDPYDQMFNQFFGGSMRPPRELRQKVQSLGSGFLVDPAGYIVTNEHVVERAADMKIHVTMADGKVYEATLCDGGSLEGYRAPENRRGQSRFPISPCRISRRICWGRR